MTNVGVTHRLKEVWQERVTRGEQFYLTMADQILKDVRRTDRHVKFFRSKTNTSSLTLTTRRSLREETPAVQHHDDVQRLSSTSRLQSR